MARVVFGGKHVVLTTNTNLILIYDVSSGQKTSLQIPSVSNGNENTKGPGPDGGSDQILASVFSSSGRYFAATDDHKNLAVWRIDESWELVSTRVLARRATALTFDKKELHILIADKSGDVHFFPIASTDKIEDKDSLVMGHVSMLLDLKLCGNDKFLVTCDRDEKIRTSNYPNAYNVQAFCLGHSDFVSCLLYMEDIDLLASGSGDGTVKLWNYKEGTEYFSVDCSAYLQHSDSVIAPRKCENTSAAESCCRGVDVKCLVYCEALKLITVAFEGLPIILLFKIQSGPVSMELLLVQRLSTSGVVWDMCFDDEQHLLTMQEVLPEGAALVPYSVQEVVDKLQITKVTDDSGASNLLKVAEQFSQESDFHKVSFAVKSKFPALHKVRIDNMTEYISKKQERIKSDQQAKNRKTETPSGVKTDEKSSEEGIEEENAHKKLRLDDD